MCYPTTFSKVLLKSHYTLVNYTQIHISTGQQTSNYITLHHKMASFSSCRLSSNNQSVLLVFLIVQPDYYQPTYKYTSPEQACSFSGYKKCP